MTVGWRPLAATRAGVLALTGLVLVGFAANPLLARQARAAGAIDAAGYTLVRLASGAGLLLLLAIPQKPGGLRTRGLPGSPDLRIRGSPDPRDQPA